MEDNGMGCFQYETGKERSIGRSMRQADGANWLERVKGDDGEAAKGTMSETWRVIPDGELVSAIKFNDDDSTSHKHRPLVDVHSQTQVSGARKHCTWARRTRSPDRGSGRGCWGRVTRVFRHTL